MAFPYLSRNLGALTGWDVENAPKMRYNFRMLFWYAGTVNSQISQKLAFLAFQMSQI